MPCIVLGVLPAIVALFIGSLPLLAWGIFFIAAAAGDIWMTWLLTKEDRHSLVLDHPSEAGFYIKFLPMQISSKQKKKYMRSQLR